mgnify:FL=1
MTTLALNARARPALLGRMMADAPLFIRLGLFLGASLAVTLAAQAIDPRLFQGESVWAKPVKFQIALTVYLLTLAFFARWLPPRLNRSRAWRIYMGIVALCIVGEMLWIGGAAALGTASHFNVSSPVWSALYSLMGVFAVTLASATLAMGIAICRNPAAGLPRPVHLSISLGLVLTFVLTVPVAGTMSANGSHLVGQAATGTGLWPIGWSREAGDLRVSHFFATHALHFIPASGVIAWAVLPERLATLAVTAGSAAFAALVAFTFVQALGGQPFLPALG